jgi:hypothetical protein
MLFLSHSLSPACTCFQALRFMRFGARHLGPMLVVDSPQLVHRPQDLNASLHRIQAYVLLLAMTYSPIVIRHSILPIQKNISGGS